MFLCLLWASVVYLFSSSSGLSLRWLNCLVLCLFCCLVLVDSFKKFKFVKGEKRRSENYDVECHRLTAIFGKGQRTINGNSDFRWLTVTDRRMICLMYTTRSKRNEISHWNLSPLINSDAYVNHLVCFDFGTETDNCTESHKNILRHFSFSFCLSHGTSRGNKSWRRLVTHENFFRRSLFSHVWGNILKGLKRQYWRNDYTG